MTPLKDFPDVFLMRVIFAVKSDVQLLRETAWKSCPADAPSTGGDTTEQATDSVAAKARQGAMCVASLTSIPGLGYTVLDIDETRCDKFLQKIVDHLHKRCD